MPANLKELARDGYIFVIQNLRGRFKSEGVFELSSQVNLADSTSTNETTDAYDTIDWLVKNVPNNNGKVGMFGVSYDGLTAAMTLLHPHPALKAISEQASPVDQWMNDDDHRYGALRESYAFEYAVYEQADKNANTHFDFETYDTYSWYLALGPLSNINAKYLHGSIPELERHRRASRLRRVLEEGGVGEPAPRVHGSQPQRRRLLGSGRSVGPVADLSARGRARSRPHELHGRRPVVSRRMAHAQGRQHRRHRARRTRDGARVSREHRGAVLPLLPARQGRKPAWKATTFQSGSNQWRTYAAWPPAGAKPTNLYLHADGTLSFDAPKADGRAYREYVSDPASPVPYRQRPISPTYPAGDWRTWEVADQRFVDGRPDVLSYTSAPLDHDLTITGEVAADLFASTSGTDADFVVKLIDVYPENAQPNAWNPEAGPQPGQYAQSLNGYELPIAMEVRRGRYNTSYEHPTALVRQQGRRVEDSAARPRSRVQGTPPDGAGAVDLVSADRSQPAEVRAEHLRGESGRLREGDAARVRVRGVGFAHRTAGSSVAR